MINTPYGQSGPRIDGYEIGPRAVSTDIPCITTVAGAAAAIQGIKALIRSHVGVAPLQVLQARLRKAWPSRAGNGGGCSFALMGTLDQAYRKLARPVLFRIGHGDAEAAHHRTLQWLAAVGERPTLAGPRVELLADIGARGTCSASSSRRRWVSPPGSTRTVSR